MYRKKIATIGRRFLGEVSEVFSFGRGHSKGYTCQEDSKERRSKERQLWYTADYPKIALNAILHIARVDIAGRSIEVKCTLRLRDVDHMKEPKKDTPKFSPPSTAFRKT